MQSHNVARTMRGFQTDSWGHFALIRKSIYDSTKDAEAQREPINVCYSLYTLAEGSIILLRIVLKSVTNSYNLSRCSNVRPFTHFNAC